MSASSTWLNKIAKQKTKLLAEMFAMEPIHVDVKDPITKKLKAHCQGEDILYLWDKLYATDPMMKNIVINTVIGPSIPGKDYYDDMNANPAMPYQQIRALIGDGGKWKWPEIWKYLDLLPRRGPAWRHIDDPSNLSKIVNPNPEITPLNCLVVGGGPIGLRLAIELVLGGHRVTLFEGRREIVDKESGLFETVGFTNRVNRPHINNFCRNDLDRLNGRNFMTPKMCYPVFTNGHTSSIGIDELQMLLLKTALLLGVNFELGVKYIDADMDIENEQNQRPSWMVSYTADKIAQERHGKEAEGQQRFDALFGCDGGRSKVRATHSDWLGVPKTRAYKKMYGIVSNLRKCSRKKLKSLGYATGLEPEDKAGGTTGIFFYKASYHNYFIVHPSSQEMEENDISWKGVFTFQKARQEVDSGKDALKDILKKYIKKKAKELKIPLDDSLPNDGFVEAPNDVMGFDFTEFYNCEKSAACFVPPLNYNAEEDGEWEIHCPLVAIAGDAVADPNWLLGVGLQRGWNSAFDACFFADNIYNNRTFNGKPPSQEDPIESPVDWSEHMDNFMNLMADLGKYARESKLSGEMDTGMLDAKGPVVVQIRRELKARNIEAPVPQYLPPVDPYDRYKPFQLAVKSNYKGKKLFENAHPLASRELAIFYHNEKFVEKDTVIKMKVTRPMAALLTWPKRFECSAFWCDMSMKLLEIDGKAAPGEKPLADEGKEKEEKKEKDNVKVSSKVKQEKPPPKVEQPKLNLLEVKTLARQKSLNLRENILQAALSGPSPRGINKKNRSAMDQLIYQAAGKGKASQESEVVLSMDTLDRSIMMPSTPSRRKLGSNFGSNDGGTTPTGLSETDRTAIQKLSEKLDQIQIPAPVAKTLLIGGEDDPIHQIRLQQVKYEKKTLKAKLTFTGAEMVKVEAEQEALKAKMLYVKAEHDMIKNLLKSYDDAEAKLKSMV